MLKCKTVNLFINKLVYYKRGKKREREGLKIPSLIGCDFSTVDRGHGHIPSPACGWVGK